ncbi:hypothetical protein LTR36_008888 [Oleoguttula mirabilis]|uniref:F-box domain-containing protein n=1 Tax=Oleoguttula mirabilis TaxID=1507867 RepID=A0AAV9J720_9PEZI|nr:hypothetical protein LTR36_008888 [Oleoguttula mirabilis]
MESPASNMLIEAVRQRKCKADDVSGHYHGLQDTLKKLRTLTNGPVLPTDQVGSLIDQLQQDAEGVKKYFIDALGQPFAAGPPTEASTAKAQEVFSSPELLEMILLQLPPRHVLAAQSINKTFEALIATSPQLQQYLGLRADPTADFATPFRHTYEGGWPYFACRSGRDTLSIDYPFATSHQEPDLDGFEIHASFSSRIYSNAILPRLGERCLSMLICQPPIYEMQASVSCCDRSRFRGLPAAVVLSAANIPGPEPVRAAAGITVGHLLEATKRLMAEHRTCPHAAPWDHDEQGNVNVAPTFKGVLQLRDRDLSLRAQRSYRQRFREDLAGETARERRMNAYIAAKQLAQVAGTEIPTMEQFIAQSGFANAPL